MEMIVLIGKLFRVQYQYVHMYCIYIISIECECLARREHA